MRYSMGDTLADNGFSFFEKLHSPIFLIQKNGKVKKVNEAGRKLLSIARLSSDQVARFARDFASGIAHKGQFDHHRVDTCKKHLKVISRQFGSSDYILVEIIR